MSVRYGTSHPLFALAVAVLLVNDHVLKGTWPGTLTGKLSDVAWLAIAPVLLASVLVRAGAPERRAAVVALGTAGGAFTLLQLWPALGQTWCTWFGGRHVADLADLWCVPALLIAPLCWRRARARVDVLPLGAIALVATSYRWPEVSNSRMPCQEAVDWDPRAPLEAVWPGDWYGSPLPVETGNFADDAYIEGPDGPVPALVLSTSWYVLFCPIGGLEPDTQYTWRVGPFENRHPNQLRIQADPWEPGLFWFRTAGASELPPLDEARCEELLRRGPTTRWRACHPDTGDSGDSGLDSGR